jgi:hypothetical protein
MASILKSALPYALAVIAAIPVFFAGAYSADYFTGKVLAPRFGSQNVAELATTYALLHSLDAGNVEEARSLLILQEDGNLMSIDMLAPYFPDDLAKSACRIMQKVAKQRTENAAKYAATEATSDPEVHKIVAASLQNPAACSRAK